MNKVSLRKIAAVVFTLALCAAPLALAQEGEKTGGSAEKAEPSMMWEWVNFAILAGLIGYLGAKQGGPFFAARAAGIRKGIDDAEIATLRETAGSERRAAEQRIKEETQFELQRIAAHAENEIETAGKSERVALQRFAAQLALELAETKVRARMSSSTEDALVQAFVRGLGTAAARPSTVN